MTTQGCGWSWAMGVIYVCDDCGSETDTLTQLEICAETDRVAEPNRPDNMPRWDEPTKEKEDLPRYERELCNVCLQRNLAEYSYLINRLYRRGAK